MKPLMYCIAMVLSIIVAIAILIGMNQQEKNARKKVKNYWDK